MYTSAIKTALTYLLISLFCALFGGIYELFGHEVYSYFMLYAFAFPLAGGTLPFLLLALAEDKGSLKLYPNTVCRSLWHAAIATMTLGSIMNGILEIYGTTNSLTGIYWYAGAGLFAGFLGFFLTQAISVASCRLLNNSVNGQGKSHA